MSRNFWNKFPKNSNFSKNTPNLILNLKKMGKNCKNIRVFTFNYEYIYYSKDKKVIYFHFFLILGINLEKF